VPLRPTTRIVLALAVSLPLVLGTASPGSAEAIQLQEFTVSEDALCDLRDRWIDHLLATNPEHTWAPIE
jgi:hypothetical protein